MPRKEIEKKVADIITDCESNMPKCYNDEYYKIYLANAISNRHIEILKERKKREREDRAHKQKAC